MPREVLGGKLESQTFRITDRALDASGSASCFTTGVVAFALRFLVARFGLGDSRFTKADGTHLGREGTSTHTICRFAGRELPGPSPLTFRLVDNSCVRGRSSSESEDMMITSSSSCA